jgi:hypothetical protein
MMIIMGNGLFYLPLELLPESFFPSGRVNVWCPIRFVYSGSFSVLIWWFLVHRLKRTKRVTPLLAKKIK